MVFTSKWGRIQPEIQIWADHLVAASWTLVRSPWKWAKMLSELRTPAGPSLPAVHCVTPHPPPCLLFTHCTSGATARTSSSVVLICNLLPFCIQMKVPCFPEDHNIFQHKTSFSMWNLLISLYKVGRLTHKERSKAFKVSTSNKLN